MKTIFVAWTPDHSRTRLLGEALGAETAFVWSMGKERGWRLLIKYGRQAWHTVRLLARHRPEAVIVQTPPVFTALLATCYSRLRPRTRVVLDTHSGSLLSSKWRWSVPLHRWCARRAAQNVLHVPSLGREVAGWGAPTLVAGYVGAPAQMPAPDAPRPTGFTVVVPSSFLPDEPVEALFEAAGSLPEISFLVTGNPNRLAPTLRAGKPANLTLTGYLENDAYHRLLASADAVLVLTTQPQTLQWGGIEAVWYGRPLITSHWEDLQTIFARGTVFVDNSPAGIAAGVQEARQRLSTLEAGIRELKADLEVGWQAHRQTLAALLATASPAAQ